MSPIVIWAVLGLVLMLTELLTLSFVLVFFGLAALLIALFKLLGLDHLIFEIVLFSMIGFSGILLFRKKLVANFTSRKNVDIDRNKPLILSHDIVAHGQARVKYQGTEWTAHNESNLDMKKGDKVFIARTEGIELYLNPSATITQEES